jgi:hypothetical protein
VRKWEWRSLTSWRPNVGLEEEQVNSVISFILEVIANGAYRYDGRRVRLAAVTDEKSSYVGRGGESTAECRGRRKG